jgi:hypothetical protein
MKYLFIDLLYKTKMADKDKAEKKHITIGDMMHIFTAGFDIFFKDYLDSNGSMVPTHERMTEDLLQAFDGEKHRFVIVERGFPSK